MRWSLDTEVGEILPIGEPLYGSGVILDFAWGGATAPPSHVMNCEQIFLNFSLLLQHIYL